MMCKNPYMRDPHVKKSSLYSTEQRNAATPFPCGRCLPCRINKSREWTHRLLLERTAHEYSCFVTLTYSDDHLPDPPYVYRRTLQLFMKRLRRKMDKPVRFFGVGEYGDKSWRPHYHLALFGVHEFSVDYIAKCWSKDGVSLGYVQCGDLNEYSARYISGYCVKKYTRKGFEKLEGREPEFSTSSRKDGGLGIGAMKKLAEQLKKDRNYDPLTSPMIRNLNHGQKTYPLGRYLTYKLAEMVGVPEIRIKAELLNYQQQIFDEHMKGGTYYWNVQESKADKRLSQKKKHQIFKQKRII